MKPIYTVATVAAGFILILTCLNRSQRDDKESKHIISPSKTTVQKQKYTYYYADNTGIPDYVDYQGKSVAIRFRADSNQKALTSLRKSITNSYQKLGNHVAERIVIGNLHPEVLWTPDEPNMATSEPYQEFTLQSWRSKK
jgi:hypothetical protein